MRGSYLVASKWSRLKVCLLLFDPAQHLMDCCCYLIHWCMLAIIFHLQIETRRSRFRRDEHKLHEIAEDNGEGRVRCSDITLRLQAYKTIWSREVTLRCSGISRRLCSPTTSFTSCFGRRLESTFRLAWLSTTVTSMFAVAARFSTSPLFPKAVSAPVTPWFFLSLLLLLLSVAPPLAE